MTLAGAGDEGDQGRLPGRVGAGGRQSMGNDGRAGRKVRDTCPHCPLSRRRPVGQCVLETLGC